MIITEEQRTEALLQLPAHLQDIYTSPEVGHTMFEVFAKYTLPDEYYVTYARIVGDAILGLHKTKDIPQKLQDELGVSADVSQRILGELSVVLQPLIEHEQQSLEPDRSGLSQLQQNFAQLREEATKEQQSSGKENTIPADLPTGHVASVDTKTETPPTAETTETDTTTAPTDTPKTATKDVQAMRTMAHDVTRIHGYGAYRDLFPDEEGSQAHKEEVIKSATQEELLQKKPKLADKPDYSDPPG